MKPRHVPVRTCAGCRQERPKREMIRVVRTPAGAVVVDTTGKVPGRGGYVCPLDACWQVARRGSLERLLKASIEPNDKDAIDQFMRQFATEAGATA